MRLRPAAYLLAFGLLLGSAGAPVDAARSSVARKAHRAMLAGVTPRRGVQHRSLTVVPLVLDAPAKGDAVSVLPDGLAWHAPAGAKDNAHAVLRGAKTDARLDALVPSGLVLRAGAHERLLLRPALIRPADGATLRTLALTKHPVGPTDPVLVGPAPPEYGHTQFLVAREDAVRDLLALEASAVGLDPVKTPPTLHAVRHHAALQERMAACRKALGPVAKAYGGATVGHAAFLGTGLVQVVLARHPESYATYMRRAVPSLALALVVWEELYGRAGDAVGDVAWPRYTDAVSRVKAFLADASFKHEKRRGESGARGQLWRVRATRATKGGRPPDVGWLVLDDAERPVWFEGWPDNAPLPPPADRGRPGSPGGGETDERTDGGARTWYFEKRFHERFPWRREPPWVRERPRPGSGSR